MQYLLWPKLCKYVHTYRVPCVSFENSHPQIFFHKWIFLQYHRDLWNPLLGTWNLGWCDGMWNLCNQIPARQWQGLGNFLQSVEQCRPTTITNFSKINVQPIKLKIYWLTSKITRPAATLSIEMSKNTLGFVPLYPAVVDSDAGC